MHRISREDSIREQDAYKKVYPPFEPYVPSKPDQIRIIKYFLNLLATQNGQDADDYPIFDDNVVERYLGSQPRGKLLLLGVGSGRETLVAKDLGFDAVGLTLGSRNVDYGISYLGLLPEEHRQCLNEALPFPSSHFDIVAGFQVFEHTLAPLLFLLEQNRVLKSGGVLILEWPPAEKYHMGSNPHHQICYTPGQAKALFEKAGFQVVRLCYDNLEIIPEKDYWTGKGDRMLCIEGEKQLSTESYITNMELYGP